MSEVKEWRPCYICGEKVLWRNLGLGWVQIQYHDCKPVPRAKLEQAERERDEARERIGQAVALMKHAREQIEMDNPPGAGKLYPYFVMRAITAFIDGQPAPAPVVDDATLRRALVAWDDCKSEYDRDRMRAALEAALEKP